MCQKIFQGFLKGSFPSIRLEILPAVSLEILQEFLQIIFSGILLIRSLEVCERIHREFFEEVFFQGFIWRIDLRTLPLFLQEFFSRSHMAPILKKVLQKYL